MTRVAIVHEWLATWAGSEKTYREIARLFPDADLYALSASPVFAEGIDGRPVQTTFLDRPGLRDRRGLTLPLMPLAWRTIRAPEYDLVISSSHACARGFRPGREATHLSYCYTPMRYVWYPDLDERGRSVPGVARSAMQRWDVRSTAWVDAFAAISTEVAARIGQLYGREARVIHPPVNVDCFTPGLDEDRDEYLLACSRFVPYKRLDLAIDAAGLTGRRLVVAGAGPDEARLRERAERYGSAITFRVAPSDEELRHLMRRAAAFVSCAREDFGIVPVEAAACGTPVVALAAGGSIDIVVDGETGVLVGEADAQAFAAGIDRLATLSLSSDRIRDHAEGFSTASFGNRIRSWVHECAPMMSMPD